MADDAGTTLETHALNEWQIAEIRKSLAEADRDDFASDGEVRAVIKKWTGKVS